MSSPTLYQNPYERVATYGGGPAALTVPAMTKDPSSGRLRVGSGSMFNDKGEINAHDKLELAREVGAILTQAAGGNIERSAAYGETQEDREERHAMYREALADESGREWVTLGETFVDSIWTTMGREAWSRQIMGLKNLKPEEESKIRIKQRDVLGYVISASGISVTPSRVRVPWFPCPEYSLEAFVIIPNTELVRNDPEVLDEKHAEAQEAIFVQEDKRTRALSIAAADTVNDVNYYSTFSPTTFQSARSQIIGWGLKPTTAIIAYNLWDALTVGAAWTGWWDPVYMHNMIFEGKLGQFLKVNLITDGIREPRLQVLNAGEMLMYGPPHTVGAITVRQQLKSRPIDRSVLGEGSQGFYFQAMQGQGLPGVRSVVYTTAS